MKHLIEIIKTYDTEPIELLNSLVFVYLGLTLLIPGSTFASNNISYRTMELAAPENVWGAVMATLGVLSLIGVANNFRWLRVSTLVFKILILSTWGVLYYIGNPLTTGGTYCILALSAAWAFVRLTIVRKETK